MEKSATKQADGSGLTVAPWKGNGPGSRLTRQFWLPELGSNQRPAD